MRVDENLRMLLDELRAIPEFEPWATTKLRALDALMARFLERANPKEIQTEKP